MYPCPEYLPTGKPFVNLKDIYQGVNDKYHRGMNIHEIRRNNLAKLIEEQFGGKQSRLADKIDRQRGYVSRLLKGTKNIGEDFARHVEESVGLPRGTLDYVMVHDIWLGEVNEPNARYNTKPEDSGDSKAQTAWEALSRAIRPELNDELQFHGHMDAWDSNTPLDPDEVELPLFREVELAAGAGQTEVIENHGAKLRFARSTLSRAGVLPENAACAFVKGNSMSPVMPDGTTVGVDTGDKHVRDGEIYAIDHGGMLRVKYLHRKPGGGIKIVSQNSIEYETEELSAQEVAESIRIIGRVFWWSVLR